MQDLLTKEKFYQMCDRYKVDYPGTFIYSREMGEEFKLPFGFPVILKPSNGINYWEHEFETQKKVYKLNTLSELKNVIKQIYDAGYSDKLIIQDFIPGDDSNMRVMICFSGKDKKVKLMSLGHVMLEEHTPHGLGNTAAMINEYNRELSETLKNFLEDVGFEGFSTFDIKYDSRDGRYKIFEVNLRQGRSNYYVTGAGYNLAHYAAEEYIYGRKLEFKIADNENLWTVIPMRVAYRYVRDEALIEKMKQLIKGKKVVNPLFLKGDDSLKRRIYLYKSHMSHFIKFKKYYK
ncbi:MAG TPA: ATP-grasp domain-containing protein [Clostridia bacterium]|nr:ATP-grasp domain-containing protein [Clostridia bacterium]